MACSLSEIEGRPGAWGRLSLWQAFGLVYATGLALVLADVADGRIFHADVDDQLRALQIRFLLSAEGSWFDLTLPFIATPEPYVSPWSRLVDLPHVLIATGLAAVLPAERALQVAFWIWPPAMLSVFSLLSAFVARRLLQGAVLSRSAEALSLVVMTVLMMIAVLEFAPGRIDHHNVQLVALLAVAAGLCRWDRAGGALIGAGSAVSVVVGLECLPFVAVAYGGLVLCHLLDVRGTRDVLTAASLAMMLTTAVSAAAFLGPAGALSVQCDAFSAPYIVLMAGFSLILGAGCLAAPWVRSPAGRAALLAVPAAGLLALVAFSFPACLAGPYAMIDPVSRANWFDRIWQEHSFLYFYGATGQLGLVAFLGLIAALIAAPLPLLWQKGRERPGAWLVYGLTVASFALTLVLTRYIRFPAALAPLFLPAVAGWFLDERLSERRRRILTATSFLCLSVFVAPYLAIPRAAMQFGALDYMAFDACKEQDFSVLATVPPGRIALPNGLALSMLSAAPEGFSVAAVPFHRASPGMKRMFEAFLSPDPAVRRAALESFDYVAVCRFPLDSDPSAAPLYAALSAGGDWPGLLRVEAPSATNFQLFRIDHAALR